MQGIFVFDLSVNTRKCGISHNKTSARNRSRARRIRFPKSRSNSGGNRPPGTGQQDDQRLPAGRQEGHVAAEQLNNMKQDRVR